MIWMIWMIWWIFCFTCANGYPTGSAGTQWQYCKAAWLCKWNHEWTCSEWPRKMTDFDPFCQSMQMGAGIPRGNQRILGLASLPRDRLLIWLLIQRPNMMWSHIRWNASRFILKPDENSGKELGGRWAVHTLAEAGDAAAWFSYV